MATILTSDRLTATTNSIKECYVMKTVSLFAFLFLYMYYKTSHTNVVPNPPLEKRLNGGQCPRERNLLV